MPVLYSGCDTAADAEAAIGAAPLAGGAVDRVTAGKPQRKTLELRTMQPARIAAFEQTPLHSKLAGYVQQVHVDIGDRVKKDSPLVILAIPELHDELAQKQALVAQAEAEVQQAQSNAEASQAAAETARAKIAEARAVIGRATGEYERAAGEYGRMKKLAENGSVTEKLVDEMLNQQRAAESSRDAALAAVSSAEAAAREAEANVRKAEADAATAAARLKVAQADMKRAETMLAYMEIRAPFDGVVTSRSVDTGHFVQPASGNAARPLLVVAHTDKVRVFVDVPEMEAGFVDTGDQVTLRVQALNGKELEAPVKRTSWSLDEMNRSLRTEVDLDNADAELRAGMYAVASILLEQRENALVLPVTAVVRTGNGTRCCAVENDKIVFRTVELGLRSGQEVQILRGLDETSTVVLTRAEALTEGQTVELLAPQK
jgi:RND family efflux transporter MFP subunit